jgi:hypothetical protein
VGERNEDRSAGRFAAVAGSDASVFRLSMISSLPIELSLVFAGPHHDNQETYVVVFESPLQSMHQLPSEPAAHQSPTP